MILCWPVIMLSLAVSQVNSIRCYTDLEATQASSLECGMSTGCVKIYKKAYEYDHLGNFIPEHKRGPDIQLFRGCFIIQAPDICFTSRDGLSYCWCSSKDLCNSSWSLSSSSVYLFVLVCFLILVTIKE